MEKLHKYFTYDNPDYQTVIYYTQINGEEYIGVEYSIKNSGSEWWVGAFYDTLDKNEMNDMNNDNIAVMNKPERKIIEKIFDFIFTSPS